MSENNLRCPLCVEIVHSQYGLTNVEGGQANWYHCRCGFMFHNTSTDLTKVYTKEYRTKREDLKFIKDRLHYYIRMYAPIIEEHTYGRRMLDVGYTTPILMQEFERRGWLTCGVDIIPSDDYLTADFMSDEFDRMLSTYDDKGNLASRERFDLIWMGDFLQCVKDPVKAIYKAYDLLRPNGILVIITPNTDLIRRNVIPAWGHWSMEDNQSFINERILREALTKCDASFNGRMEILYLDKSNQSNRFPSWNNMHCIAQKVKIEESIFSKMEKEDDSTVRESQDKTS